MRATRDAGDPVVRANGKPVYIKVLLGHVMLYWCNGWKFNNRNSLQAMKTTSCAASAYMLSDDPFYRSGVKWRLYNSNGAWYDIPSFPLIRCGVSSARHSHLLKNNSIFRGLGLVGCGSENQLHILKTVTSPMACARFVIANSRCGNIFTFFGSTYCYCVPMCNDSRVCLLVSTQTKTML